MARILVDFEWPVAAGYEIKEPNPRSKPARLLDGDPDGRGPVIVAKAASVEIKRPLELRDILYLDFAALDGSPGSCLEFARRWGLLGLYKEPLRSNTEPLSLWQQAIDRCRNTVDAWRNGLFSDPNDMPKWGTLDYRLIQAPGSSWTWKGWQYALQLRPPSLLSAMWLQFAQAVASDKSIKSCDFCGMWFEAGLGTDRRTGSRFCSDSCRSKFHNKRRSKEVAQ